MSLLGSNMGKTFFQLSWAKNKRRRKEYRISCTIVNKCTSFCSIKGFITIMCPIGVNCLLLHCLIVKILFQ
jgi:hypothetical protein